MTTAQTLLNDWLPQASNSPKLSELRRFVRLSTQSHIRQVDHSTHLIYYVFDDASVLRISTYYDRPNSNFEKCIWAIEAFNSVAALRAEQQTVLSSKAVTTTPLA